MTAMAARRWLDDRPLHGGPLKAPASVDFSSNYDAIIAQEEVQRQKRVRDRTRAVEDYVASLPPERAKKFAKVAVAQPETRATQSVEEYTATTTSNPPTSKDDNINIYEALYIAKANQLTPEDFADRAPVTPAVKSALNNISMILQRARGRRQVRADIDTSGQVGQILPEGQPPPMPAAGTEASTRVRAAVTPWFRFLFRKSGEDNAPEMHRSDGKPGTAPTNAVMDRFATLSFTERLHEEILAFCAWSDLTAQETDVRRKVLANISVISQELWPECQLAPFGSFFNGLSLPGADIDVCLLNVPGGEQHVRTHIHNLARVLRQCPFAMEITAVTKARVPIVKFRDAHSRVQVDLTINQSSALETSGFIYDKLLEWRYLRPLILVVKLLLRNHDLNETYKGGVGSYMLFNMIVHHLQEESKSVMRAKRNSEGSLPGALDKNLGDLLVSFLQRFVNFDYFFSAIDIRGHGNVFAKCSVCDEPNNRLYIRSPLEPSLDVGKSTYRIEELIELFQKCYRKLTMQRSVEGAESSKTYSILANVLSVESETFLRRLPAGHPRRDDFSAYSPPQFPEVTDRMIQAAYSEIRPYLRRLAETRREDYSRHPRRDNYNPYDSRPDYSHRHVDAPRNHRRNPYDRYR